MNRYETVHAMGFALSLLGPLLVFGLYPAAMWLMSRLRRPHATTVERDSLPTVSILVAVRNAEALVEQKIANCLALDYPDDSLEIVLYSDGSTDRTETVIQAHSDPRLRVFTSAEHIGKTEALNRGIKECLGEIVLFTDVDAILATDALEKLARHFQDPEIGGVCGQRMIAEDHAALATPQSNYITFDSSIKTWESRVGSITSNDGKIYAIRKDCFRPIAEAVTDDFFVCLNVVAQEYRFVFEPEARAGVRLPSRSGTHEVGRRRRIVSRSLRGMFVMRSVFNPLRHGLFSLRLFINKVLRRFVPVFLVNLFVASVMTRSLSPAISVFLALQIAFYLAAMAYPVARRLPLPKALLRPFSMAFYFCVGNWGTLLGLVDFILGRKILKWDPVKSGN
jgi:cellulose synthase/poly-beta-1,6-N-acetylglucosamine synthase-like glycosyltransferase